MLTQMGNHACCLWKKSDDVKFRKFQADVNSPLYKRTSVVFMFKLLG